MTKEQYHIIIELIYKFGETKYISGQADETETPARRIHSQHATELFEEIKSKLRDQLTPIDGELINRRDY